MCIDNTTTLFELAEKAKKNQDILICNIIKSFPDTIKTIDELKRYDNDNSQIPIPEWNKNQVIEYSETTK